MRAVRDLGDSLAKAWRQLNFDERRFPELAKAALVDAKLQKVVRPVDIIRWFCTVTEVPEQRLPESTFGTPPVTLYSGDHFFIDALFWLDGWTDIHQHGFSGAFQVLAGSSIHSLYRFEEEQRVNSGMRFGKVVLEEAELLRTGDVRAIRGASTPHAVFHLDRPTVTLMARTTEEQDQLPQLAYLPPFFAKDAFRQGVVARRRVLALDLLLQTQPLEYVSLLDDLLVEADLESAYEMLESCYEHFKDSHILKGAVETLRKRFGARADQLLSVLEESGRKKELAKMREGVANPEERFVLAVVQNVPDRSLMLRVTRERFPDDAPETVIARWLTILAPEVRDDSPNRKVFERLLTNAAESSADKKAKQTRTQLLCSPLLKPLWK